ncbi:DMT family transporter [Lampropedia aestuarii]|uniref:DMT family transporter n=1 Tax=Lampropedia aestuarii TaxID=2562762 RepID=UPI0024699385|nr:DMT family transporter [Lampropedia aestuarii]MDH5856053.1 DMT family transporter [Lampropedia aestuarii]
MTASQAAAALRAQPAQMTGFKSLLWLSLMVLLWGLSWPATKLALNTVPPLWLAAIRFGSAALCLFGLLAVRGKLVLPTRVDWPIVASIGFLQMMVFTGLGMIAMVHVDTSRAVLLAYTTPLWGVVVGWLALRQTPTRWQLAALLLGLAGIGLICSPWEMDWSAPGAVMGAAFLLVGAISWSVVILHIKRHRWSASPLALAPWQMLLATVPLAAIAYGLEGAPTEIAWDLRLVELLVFIGPIATSACFVISAEHGRRVSTFTMSNFTLGVPLIGILASVLFLGNQLTVLFAAGLGLVVAGMVLAATAMVRAR